MNKKEIIKYLKENNSAELFSKADLIRKNFCGNDIYIRGIIEFSNNCIRNCLYCGLRNNNATLQRFRMNKNEIIKTAVHIIENKIKTIILQSGDDGDYSRNFICNIIKTIKTSYPETAITLSLGERPHDDYRAFKDSGADRYLLKHETSNPMLYAKLHPIQNFKERISSLNFLRKIGFQIGIGNIVGLPEQTLEDLANDILFIDRLNPDMVGIGPFIPHHNTPLKNNLAGNLNLTLKTLALVRIITKSTHIPSTTALAALSPNGQKLALQAGANVIMANFTPESYSRTYSIYDNKQQINLKHALQTVKTVGRQASFERGDSLKI